MNQLNTVQTTLTFSLHSTRTTPHTRSAVYTGLTRPRTDKKANVYGEAPRSRITHSPVYLRARGAEPPSIAQQCSHPAKPQPTLCTQQCTRINAAQTEPRPHQMLNCPDFSWQVSRRAPVVQVLTSCLRSGHSVTQCGPTTPMYNTRPTSPPRATNPSRQPPTRQQKYPLDT